MATAFVALGSNIGDRWSHITHAVRRLGEISSRIAGSPVYETSPVGGPDGQDPYLNAVVKLDTDLAPLPLLQTLFAIEQERGRVRDERWGPRTLDLDLLWYDGQIIEDESLTVPHPEIRNRPFVLAPLADLDPSLADDAGFYAESFDASGSDGLHRLTGPLAEEGDRWMAGIADVTDLDGGDGHYSCVADPDWTNASGDNFGGFLMAACLVAVERESEGLRPSQITHRFLKGVPMGSEMELTTTTDRSGTSSKDVTVELRVGGEIAGLSTVGLIKHREASPRAPSMPDIMDMHQAIPVTKLVEIAGHHPGTALQSWQPLERWDGTPGTGAMHGAFRAWSPNAATGSHRPFLQAASILMPIDALIWPAAMQELDALTHRERIHTPTIELTARLADVADEHWYVGEATIDHLAGRTIAGTVRVWGASGRYQAVGHSLNLTVR